MHDVTELGIEDRLLRLEQRFELVKYPIVREGSVLPPVGVIADFIDEIDDEAISARARRDFLPIPAPENREQYGYSHSRYWMSGLEDYDKFVAACEHFDIAGGRYYDFGGATGRVFRHAYCQDRKFEVWSSDFKVANFQWNQQHMPGDMRVFLNAFAPPLPIPDHHFDAVTAFSVFTHIDELESPWLLELRRILRPGGLLYATIHDEEQWAIKSESVLRAINLSENGADITADSPFPGERTAFHFTEGSYYGCNIFHPTTYIRREWGRFFKILDIRPRDHYAQCVVLLTYD